MPPQDSSQCATQCATDMSSYLQNYLITNVPQQSSYADFTTANNAQLYRKASLLLQGTLPTLSNSQLAANADQTSLRTLLRELMQGEAFTDFLMEGANDQLLVRKWANSETPGLDLLFSDYFIPTFRDRYDAAADAATQAELALQTLCTSYPQGTCNTNDIYAGTAPDDVIAAYSQLDNLRATRNRIYTETNKAIADAPLRLIAEVVNNDLPYSEVLTANYVMMNPYSAAVYAPEVTFADSNNADEWVRGQITSMTDEFDNGQWGIVESNYPAQLPMAGILTTPAFLGRYPTTETNRNRARARWAYTFFLGTDIESLAQRPMDSAALMDTNNPTLNNPACAACHTTMDPVAGAFQSWGDSWTFKQRNGIDSLPNNYVWADYQQRIYQSGDHWFRDNRLPGFEGNLMPTLGEYKAIQGQYDDGLQWLAHQMIADDRFASATVKFWWPAMFGNRALTVPNDEQANDYSEKMSAWNAQQALINELAEQFTASNFDLKSLLVAMLLSDEFSANRYTGNTNVVNHVGFGRLQSPEQLSRKLLSLTGYRWTPTWDRDADYLLSDYYALFGGIDSDTMTKRASNINTLMSAVLERVALETSCPMVFYDLAKPTAERILLPYVQAEDTPISNGGEAKIKANIHYLLQRFWGVDLALDDTEVDAAYQLFTAIWQQRQTWRSEQPDWGNYLTENDWSGDSSNDAWDEFCYDMPSFDWASVNWSQPKEVLGNYYNPEQTVRTWAAVISYLMTDPLFVFE